MDLHMTLRDGTPLSKIALGTLYFGSKISEEHCNMLLESYVSMGGNQVDTARGYADWLPGGESASERAIGKWLSGRSRETIFLGTKGGIKPRGFNSTRGDLSPENIEKDLATSLETLGTEYVDLYWLHRDDIRFEPEEIVEMMNQLIQRGIIRYYGVSNWKAERIEKANVYAAKSGLQGISASQIQYGLGACTVDAWGDPTIVCMDQKEYQKYCKLQIPVYAYSAQAEGYFPIYLSGGSDKLTPDTRRKYDSEINRRRAERLDLLSRKKEISLSWIMAEYVLNSPFPAVFILGGSNERRLREIMADYKNNTRQLSTEEWQQVLA